MGDGSDRRREHSGRARVLVTDDNVDGAKSLALLLELMGHEVCIAHDGLEALRMAAVFMPDIVFMDIRMPGLDGFETTRRLRNMGCCKNTTIVALTAYGDESHRARSLSAGMSYHLVKPPGPVELDYVLKKRK